MPHRLVLGLLLQDPVVVGPGVAGRVVERVHERGDPLLRLVPLLALVGGAHRDPHLALLAPDLLLAAHDVEGGDVGQRQHRAVLGGELEAAQVLEVGAVLGPQRQPGLDLLVAGVEAAQPQAAEGELEDLRHVLGGQAGALGLGAVDRHLDLAPGALQAGRDVLDAVHGVEPPLRLLGQPAQLARVGAVELDREVGRGAALLAVVLEEDAHAGGLGEPVADLGAQLLDLVLGEAGLGEGEDRRRLVLGEEAVDALDPELLFARLDVALDLRHDLLGVRLVAEVLEVVGQPDALVGVGREHPGLHQAGHEGHDAEDEAADDDEQGRAPAPQRPGQDPRVALLQPLDRAHPRRRLLLEEVGRDERDQGERREERADEGRA